MTQERIDKFNEIQGKLWETLERDVWVEDIWPHHELPIICIEISGDWKHDHLRADYLLKQLGGVSFGEKITEDDGTDSYTSIHYFSFA